MCFTIYKLFVLQIIIKPLGFLKHYGFSKERTQQKLLKSFLRCKLRVQNSGKPAG